MSSVPPSRSTATARDRQRHDHLLAALPGRRGRRDVVALGLGALLLLPEVLLGANDIDRQRFPWVVATVELLSLLAALVIGAAAAGLLLHAREWSRGALVAATLLTLSVGAAGFVLMNAWPLPYVFTRPAAGVPTVNGFLNAVHIAIIVGSGAAALRLAAHQIGDAHREARASR